MNRYELHEELKKKAYDAGYAAARLESRGSYSAHSGGQKPVIVAGFRRSETSDEYILRADLMVGGLRWAVQEMISRQDVWNWARDSRDRNKYMELLKEKAVKQLLEGFADSIEYKTSEDL